MKFTSNTNFVVNSFDVIVAGRDLPHTVERLENNSLGWYGNTRNQQITSCSFNLLMLTTAKSSLAIF